MESELTCSFVRVLRGLEGIREGRRPSRLKLKLPALMLRGVRADLPLGHPRQGCELDDIGRKLLFASWRDGQASTGTRPWQLASHRQHAYCTYTGRLKTRLIKGFHADL